MRMARTASRSAGVSTAGPGDGNACDVHGPASRKRSELFEAGCFGERAWGQVEPLLETVAPKP